MGVLDVQPPSASITGTTTTATATTFEEVGPISVLSGRVLPFIGRAVPSN